MEATLIKLTQMQIFLQVKHVLCSNKTVIWPTRPCWGNSLTLMWTMMALWTFLYPASCVATARPHMYWQDLTSRVWKTLMDRLQLGEVADNPVSCPIVMAMGSLKFATKITSYCLTPSIRSKTTNL